jgi:hypothetical protein
MLSLSSVRGLTRLPPLGFPFKVSIKLAAALLVDWTVSSFVPSSVMIMLLIQCCLNLLSNNVNGVLVAQCQI